MNENNKKEEINEIDIKEELYLLYLEIKGELKKKCIEIDKNKFDDNITHYKTKTLLNYLKEMVYIILNDKFQNKKIQTSSKSKANENDEINNKNIKELETQIKKYQADIRALVQKLFQYKIQKDAMETKINSYIEMEKEFDILKEKVKYEGGRFLTNDRKDNEILILRGENSILKKEILKNEKSSKHYENTIKNSEYQIKDLKSKLNQLNKKLLMLETNHISNNNNSLKTINNTNTITTNGRRTTSSRWIKKCSKGEKYQTNNTNLNGHKRNFSMQKNKKLNSKYSKLDMKGIENSNEKTLSRGNSNTKLSTNNQTKKKSLNSKKNISTIENYKLGDTYYKIMNNLKNYKVNNTASKKTITTTYHKKNSISVCMENEKNDEYSRFSTNRNIRNKSGTKHKIYNKIMNAIPNPKLPLTSKHNTNKNIIPSFPKKCRLKKNNSFFGKYK